MPKNRKPTDSDWYVDPKTGELVDPDDAPPLTKEMLDRADAHVGGKLVRRGRPKAAAAKQHVSLRLAPDVLEPFKATGQGWQTRIEDTLRTALEKGLAAGVSSAGAPAAARAAKRSPSKAPAARRVRSA
jgi:uncharacterized protein (DUF4415 family)